MSKKKGKDACVPAEGELVCKQPAVWEAALKVSCARSSSSTESAQLNQGGGVSKSEKHKHIINLCSNMLHNLKWRMDRGPWRQKYLNAQVRTPLDREIQHVTHKCWRKTCDRVKKPGVLIHWNGVVLSENLATRCTQRQQ